jgi:hypothetical protein
MSFKPPKLLRTAVLDYGPIEALSALIWGELKPTHLRSLELALRALMTVDTIRVRPFVDGFGNTYQRMSGPPIGDAALDYEFEYDNGKFPPLDVLIIVRMRARPFEILQTIFSGVQPASY